MLAYTHDNSPLHHQYGTRKSHNVAIRPAARLRSSPEPTRRLRNEPDPSLPEFPPSHVVLHPDDANSKVFLAIGRAFLSVDNRAMTIKDLAEMVLNYGLVAQNVSAASQAITTYIRTHLQRCDDQQDIPLLLRHVLSGTDADDDLLPALYSRSGGAHCSTHPENRVTNFRRGTMVWYLSRATGAACPFARVGIRLSDYGENGKVGQPGNVAREKKRAKMLQRHANDQFCGQKRKRSLRSSTSANAARDSGTESETDHDEPPPKVKLTLRLKPLAKCTSSSPSNSSSTQAPVNVRNIVDFSNPAEPSSLSSSSSDSDSESSIQNHPIVLHPISIPPYTPSSNDGLYPSYPATEQLFRESYRRSPSLAYSISSPPPESDDEEELDEDESQYSTTRSRRNFYNFSEDEEEDDEDWEEEGEVDSEADGETLWESPGPRSPSAPPNAVPLPDTRVKEEPRDVQGMLDAWDHFDSSMADAKVVEVIAQAAAVLNPETIGGSTTATSKVKDEDPWDWEPPFTQNHDWPLGIAEDTIRIKQEEFDLGIESLFPSARDDSFELDSENLDRHCQDTIKQRAKTAPLSQSSISALFPGSPLSPAPRPSIRTTISTEQLTSTPHLLALPPPMSPGAAALVQLIQALSVQSPTSSTAACIPPPVDPPTQPSIVPTPPSVPPSSLVLTPISPTPPAQQPCVSPQAVKAGPCKEDAEGIVVHTCQPCNPSISATQIEEISVYQMMLGPFLLLRRIDTDFVNLTPIVEWCGKGRGYPVLSTVPNAIVIGRGWGSEKILGVWVPLEVAQSYVRDLDTRSTEDGKSEGIDGLNVFLSDELVERFPSALKDFHRTNSSGRMLKQFGRWFESMVTFAHAQANAAGDTATVASGGPLNPQKVIQVDSRQSWIQKETVLPVPLTGTFALGAVLAIGEKEKQNVVSPLSAKEEAMFQELCVIPGEEEENMPVEIEERRMDVEAVIEKQEEEEDISKVIVSGNAVRSPSSLPEDGDKDAEASASKSKGVATRTRTTRAATTSKVLEKQALEKQEKQRSLRRSKRVADALAAQTQQQQQQRSRTRKRPGSRNTLS
ncbi:hypothetical protein AN958_08228 [Leucoagaricus sp. SymC.cos]|nr:hypothetical protein AN958_08228 [Leucoagaricus sp. SymC.cos]